MRYDYCYKNSMLNYLCCTWLIRVKKLQAHNNMICKQTHNDMYSQTQLIIKKINKLLTIWYKTTKYLKAHVY